MNASEIEYIEARLPVGLKRIPSPEQMDHLMAIANRERNRHMAEAFNGFVAGVSTLLRAVRSNAASCTDARLHHTHA